MTYRPVDFNAFQRTNDGKFVAAFQRTSDGKIVATSLPDGSDFGFRRIPGRRQVTSTASSSSAAASNAAEISDATSRIQNIMTVASGWQQMIMMNSTGVEEFESSVIINIEKFLKGFAKTLSRISSSRNPSCKASIAEFHFGELSKEVRKCLDAQVRHLWNGAAVLHQPSITVQQSFTKRKLTRLTSGVAEKSAKAAKIENGGGGAKEEVKKQESLERWYTEPEEEDSLRMALHYDASA
jgi:hypothetical protein